MNESSKIYIKNIPDNFPDDKFLEILKKNFETLIFNINIYKHCHKFKSKLNKVCYFYVKSPETKQKVFDFITTFDMIDQRGVKYKLKAVDPLFTSVIQKKTDPINNTIANILHYQKFVEFTKNGKLLEFRQEEDKYNEGIFDDVDIKPVEVEKPVRNTKVIQNTNPTVGKKIIINKVNQERTQERNQENVETNHTRTEVLDDQAPSNQNYTNQSNQFVKGYNNNNRNNGYYQKTNSYNNRNNYSDYNSYNNDYNNNNYTNYNSNGYNQYNNNYYNNDYSNDGYYENESNYNKKNNRHYKK